MLPMFFKILSTAPPPRPYCIPISVRSPCQVFGLPWSNKKFLVAVSNLFVSCVLPDKSIPSVANSKRAFTLLTPPPIIALSNSFAKSLSSSVSLKPFSNNGLCLPCASASFSACRIPTPMLGINLNHDRGLFTAVAALSKTPASSASSITFKESCSLGTLTYD